MRRPTRFHRARGVRGARVGALGAALALCATLAASSVSPPPAAAATGIARYPDPSPVPVPHVTGPITGPGGITLISTGIDLAAQGYSEREYFLSGRATRYRTDGPPPSDGRWAAVPDGTAPYKTRIVVYAPTDPSHFNGTVLMEWLNVSAGADTAPDWIDGHTELMRAGFAYVGVSAQQQGIDGGVSVFGSPVQGLRQDNPARYGSLVDPGDAYSYDIYSQAAQAVLHSRGVKPLGSLHPRAIIADGESQSAFFLTTYYDAIEPLDHIFDGFFVHSRGGGGSLLEPAADPSSTTPSDGGLLTFSTHEPFRTDLGVPVLALETESDVTSLGYAADRQPDDPSFRDWEVAGTSHADAYLGDIGLTDDGSTNAQTLLDEAGTQTIGILGCDQPVNTGPQHWVVDAAQAALNTWVRTGTPPHHAPRLVEVLPTYLERDANGNAVGGIRTPAVDAPISALSGLPPPTGSLLCALFGTTTAFSTAKLQALYPTHAAYVAAVTRSADADVRDGFLLAPDAAEIVAAAQAAPVP